MKSLPPITRPMYAPELPFEQRKLIPVVGLFDDGNAFAVVGKATRAARRAGWRKPELDAFKREATSGDYDHLLQTVMGWFEDADEEDDG
jgi:hypothetical protein